MKKVGNLFAYRINPVDFGWEDLLPADEYRRRLALRYAECDHVYERQELLDRIQQFETFFAAAMDAGQEVGWEGDFRKEPHVGFVPVEVSMSSYIIWKQDNNGDTFVVSHLELPWLNGYDS